MAAVHTTLAALLMSGDELDPDELTRTLGIEPSTAHRKGDAMRPRASGAIRMRKSGLWLLRATDRIPGDLNSQINELLDRLPSDLDVWKRLAIYKPELSIGLFLEGTNEGIQIGEQIVRALAVRGVALDFDIYGPIAEPLVESRPDDE